MSSSAAAMGPSELPEGVKFRRATSADENDVVAMRMAHQGLDYLPYMYPRFMAMSNVYCFLLEKDGRPVCFAYRILVDDGQTAITGGARTVPELEGQGLTKILESLINQTMAEERPTVRRQVFAALYEKQWEERYKAMPEIFSVLSVRQIASFRTSIQQSAELLSISSPLSVMTNPADIWQPLGQDLVNVMMAESSNRELFPDGLFIANWEPCQFFPSNMEHVSKLSRVFVSSRPGSPSLSAVSVTTVLPFQGGLRCDLEFYGKTLADLRQHLYWTLLYVTSLGDHDPSTRVELLVYFPQDLDRRLVVDMMTGLGMSPGVLHEARQYACVEYSHQIMTKYWTGT